MGHVYCRGYPAFGRLGGVFVVLAKTTLSLIGLLYRKTCCRIIVMALFVFVMGVPFSAMAQPADSVGLTPFVNLSQQSSDDWIGPGILETLANALQQRGLTVALIESSGTTDESAFIAGRTVNAEWLVRGSYQRVGDALRITVRVLHVESGVVQQSRTIDGVVEDLFQLQDQVAVLVGEVVAQIDSAQVAELDRDSERSAGVDTSTQTRSSGRGGFVATPAREVPRAVIYRTSEPPQIDGQLDDPVWETATHITDFVQIAPIAGAPGSEETEVWMAYDSDNLYFAFYAHYSDTGIMRVNWADRDETRGDDQMSVLFDPFLDQQRAYQFEVNGYGIQSDSLVNAEGTRRRSSRSSSSSFSNSLGSSYWQRGGGGSSLSSSGTFGVRGDDSWNALFESDGQLVSDGWTAEMAIPFKSLRYPARQLDEAHVWGFQITRRIRGRSEAQSWSPVSRDIAGQLTQFGILEGLEGLSQSRNIEVLPELTGISFGSLDRETGSYNQNDPEGDVGMGFKYGITPNLTADFTYNPDFSQIEADRPQIETNQRYALFYPEQRPFFLEGQEIFQIATPMALLNTRTIVDPRFGGKLTGKVGDTTLGVIVADDEAAGNFDDSADSRFGLTSQTVVGRARYDVYSESYLGAIMTAREFGQDYSRVAGIDGRFRLGQTHRLSFMAVGSSSHSEDEGGLAGPAVEVDLTRQGRNFGYSASYGSIDPDFRAESGFIPRVDLQQANATMSYRWWPESTLMTWGPSVTYFRLYDHAGELQDEQVQAQTSLQFRNNISLTTTINRDLERYREIDFKKTNYGVFGVVSGRTLSVYGGFNGGDGILFSENPYVGRNIVGNVNVSIRPHSRMRVELNNIFSQFVNRIENAEVFDVKIFRTRTTFQLSRRFLLRHIAEHNTQAVSVGNNLLLTYRINAGTVVFLGYDDRYQRGTRIDNTLFPFTRLQRTNRAVFTKVSYLFRL